MLDIEREAIEAASRARDDAPGADNGGCEGILSVSSVGTDKIRTDETPTGNRGESLLDAVCDTVRQPEPVPNRIMSVSSVDSGACVGKCDSEPLEQHSQNVRLALRDGGDAVALALYERKLRRDVGTPGVGVVPAPPSGLTREGHAQAWAWYWDAWPLHRRGRPWPHTEPAAVTSILRSAGIEPGAVLL